jgi:Spy/CpxP family protein refolding chaperone
MKSKISRVVLPALFTVGLIAGAAHVASSNSMATGGHMGHRGHRGMDSLGLPLPILLHTANLTDAQKAQVKQIFESRRDARKAEYEQLKTARDQIASKYAAAGTVSATDLAEPVQQITKIQDQMTQEQMQDAIAVRNVLTPAQLQQMGQTKSKLDQIRSEMHALFASSHDATPNTSPTE